MIKVYGLFYCFPYEGEQLDSLWLSYEEAEIERKKKRPRKHWEVRELEINNSGGRKITSCFLVYEVE